MASHARCTGCAHVVVHVGSTGMGPVDVHAGEYSRGLGDTGNRSLMTGTQVSRCRSMWSLSAPTRGPRESDGHRRLTTSRDAKSCIRRVALHEPLPRRWSISALAARASVIKQRARRCPWMDCNELHVLQGQAARSAMRRVACRCARTCTRTRPAVAGRHDDHVGAETMQSASDMSSAITPGIRHSP